MPANDPEGPKPTFIKSTAGPSAAGNPLGVWLLASAGGDRAAYRQLYHATQSKLFGVAMLLVRRRDVAEDVLQEAYMRIWAGAWQYSRERGEALPWMAQIVRNAAVDRLRRERPIHDDIDEHGGRITATSPKPDERLDIVRSLAWLEPARRRATLLSALYGYTNEEVAERIGVPLSTAKTWIRRSKQRLRVRLAG
jgi:RNA polymerase sigma-70 factor, ECF subfamily